MCWLLLQGIGHKSRFHARVVLRKHEIVSRYCVMPHANGDNAAQHNGRVGSVGRVKGQRFGLCVVLNAAVAIIPIEDVLHSFEETGNCTSRSLASIYRARRQCWDTVN